MANFAVHKHLYNPMLKITDNLSFINDHNTFPTLKRIFFFLVVLPVIMLALTECQKDERDGQGEKKEAFVREVLEDINADSLEAHLKWLQSMGTRFALADNHRSVALRIRNKLRVMGYADAELDSFFLTRTYRNVTYNQWQYNVIAVLRGINDPDSACVIGSHYDSILGTGDPFASAPGAHDNASGTAATLEIARVMKKHGFTPDKSIVFIAFGAEELGLHGSNNYASDPGEFSGKISFMLNNDMIGYETSIDPAAWQVNILDYPNSAGFRSQAESIITKYTSLGYVNDNTYNRQSDSYPFSQRGYRALFFSAVDDDPFYHTSNDVAANINFAYCREVTKVSCAILIEKNY